MELVGGHAVELDAGAPLPDVSAPDLCQMQDRLGEVAGLAAGLRADLTRLADIVGQLGRNLNARLDQLSWGDDRHPHMHPPPQPAPAVLPPDFVPELTARIHAAVVALGAELEAEVQARTAALAREVHDSCRRTEHLATSLTTEVRTLMARREARDNRRSERLEHATGELQRLVEELAALRHRAGPGA
jgi:hypothetical protein